MLLRFTLTLAVIVIYVFCMSALGRFLKTRSEKVAARPYATAQPSASKSAKRYVV